MKNKNNKRSSFSGKIGFVLSAAGASVGLGNIWRFPYLAAKYGGGIFLVIYIILALTFGYAMIVAETSVGRMTGKSPVGAYQSFGKSGWLAFGGWINAIIPILIVPYYSVIGGWVIKYLLEYALGMVQGLQRMVTFQNLSRTVPPRKSALLSLRYLLLELFMPVCVTGLNVFPNL